MAIEVTSVTHAPGTKVWEQERRDVWNDTLKTARDIGRVRLNHSRLNVFSSLAEGDKVDHFRFQVASRGKLRIGVYRDSETRIEILNKRGRVIADSKEGTGRHHERFLRMVGDGEIFEAGDYYVRVSRLDSRETTPERPFAVQLQIGTDVKNDFDTTEYEAKGDKPAITSRDPTAGAMPSAAVIGGGWLSDMLNAGMEFFNKVTRPLINSLLGGRNNLP